MKLYDRFRGWGQRLRTGLSVLACVFCTACFSAGCGSEGELLSELRQESREDPEEETCAAEERPAGDTAQSEEEGACEAESAKEGTDAVNAEETAQKTGGDGAEQHESIYVHVCGAVERPGVYEMPAGSRFYEAVEKAGGFAEDASRDYLNMAAPLADGSRLEIPLLSEIRRAKEDGGGGNPSENPGDKEYSYYSVPEMPAAQGKSAENPEAGLVNINTADVAGLCALPGIGEGRAKAIIEYREKQGGFRKKEDIMQVSGIGEKMYARMESYLSVE